MLRGRFGGTSGRPYLEARLILPRLSMRGNVSFLVDTGADASVLMPDDAHRLGVDHSRLTGRQEYAGIGGATQSFVEPALIVFSEPGRNLYVYSLDLAIMPATAEAQGLPTLLGRDILDRWRMVYYPAKRQLTFRVISADLTVPVREASATGSG